MRKVSGAIATVMLAALLAATMAPFMESKSQGNPCASCHSNYYEYLDILEGDPGNLLPTVINEEEVLAVKVVVKPGQKVLAGETTIAQLVGTAPEEE